MPKRKLTLEQLDRKLDTQHALRLEQLKANPNFTADLEALELLLNQSTGPFPPRHRNPKWQQFESRWHVCVMVRRKEDGRRYVSLGPAGVKGQIDPCTGQVIITDPGNYGSSIEDMARLLKPIVRALQRPWAPRARYRVGPAKVKVAWKLKAEGKSLQEIAAQLYPDEYKAAMAPAAEPNEATRARHLQLIIQYREQGISWLQAEKKAAADLGIDVRTKKAKVAKLTKRVRVLLRQK